MSHGLLARIEGVGNIISPFITFTLFLGDRALQKLGCGVFSQSYVLILKSTQKQNALMTDLRIPTKEVQTEQNTKFTSGSRSAAVIHSMSSKD